jgi:CDP-diacylglycerol--glycerol-3-phosphate 3-phosphatidyltransferase
MRHHVPNILSVSRIILTPVFFILYMMNDPWLRTLSLVVYTAAALTDYFDGHYARKYGVESSLGTFIDPLADKILTFAAFFALPTINAQLFPWWPVVLIVLRDIAVTWMRVHATQRGVEMRTRYSAKVKTFIQMGYLYVALVFGLILSMYNFYGNMARQLAYRTEFLEWGLYLVAAVTLYTGIEYAVVNRNLFRREHAANT